MSSNTMPNGSTDSDSNIEATAKDDVHHALSMVLDLNEQVLELIQESDEHDKEDEYRLKEYRDFLRNVITGPRDFTDPEGTGHVVPHNTRDYRAEWGNQAPTIETEEQSKALDQLGISQLTEISGDSIPAQEVVNLPMAPNYEEPVMFAPPEGELHHAKELVKDAVMHHIPESGPWFDYMEKGDESVLEAESDPQSQPESSTSDSDLEEPYQQLTQLEGLGEGTAKKVRKAQAKYNVSLPEPSEIDMSITERFDSTDEVARSDEVDLFDLTEEQIDELSEE